MTTPTPEVTENVTLRPLRRDDFDRVLELERLLFGIGAWSYGMLAEELAGLGRTYLVAVEPEHEAVGRSGAGRAHTFEAEARRVVGYAGLWYDGEVTQVMTLGVDPAWQRLGAGRALMEALIERSRALGAEAMWLEVAVDNEPALALYRDFGFAPMGIRRRYYQPEGKDAQTMRLDLAETGAEAGAGAGIESTSESANESAKKEKR